MRKTGGGFNFLGWASFLVGLSLALPSAAAAERFVSATTPFAGGYLSIEATPRQRGTVLPAGVSASLTVSFVFAPGKRENESDTYTFYPKGRWLRLGSRSATIDLPTGLGRFGSIRLRIEDARPVPPHCAAKSVVPPGLSRGLARGILRLSLGSGRFARIAIRKLSGTIANLNVKKVRRCTAGGVPPPPPPQTPCTPKPSLTLSGEVPTIDGRRGNLGLTTAIAKGTTELNFLLIEPGPPAVQIIHGLTVVAPGESVLTVNGSQGSVAVPGGLPRVSGSLALTAQTLPGTEGTGGCPLSVQGTGDLTVRFLTLGPIVLANGSGLLAP